jgi:cystathionine beta-lyase
MRVDQLDTLRRRRSAKWRTYPGDVLPLFVAEMDYPLAPPVAAVLRAAVDASDVGYAATGPDLGVAVAGFAARHWDWEIDPAAVTAVTDVGVGAVELLRVLTRPADTVVISPPVYPPFLGWVPEAGTRLREVPLTAEFRLDLAALEAAFAERPAVYLLCNPHNPVGRVHTRDELTELVRLARRYGVKIISDEIHGPLTLPGARLTPLLSIPGAGPVAASIVSASKAFNLAGLKCAAVVTGDPAMAELVGRFPADLPWRTGHLGVLATIAAYTDGDAWLAELNAELDERRTQLGELLRTRLPRVTWRPPEATFLAWLNCAALGPDDEPQRRFLAEGRVAVEPGTRFGPAAGGYVRLNFGTSAEILDEATARMASITGW